METAFMETAFTLAGVVLGSCISGFFLLLQSKIQKKNDDFVRKSLNMIQQYISLYRLEQMYAEKLASRTGESAKIIKEKMRQEVEDQTNVHVSFTEKNAKDLLQTWGK